MLEISDMVSAAANDVTATSRQRRATIQCFVETTRVISNPLKRTYNLGTEHFKFHKEATAAKCKCSGQKRVER